MSDINNIPATKNLHFVAGSAERVTAGSYRLQQLAKTAGLSMQVVAEALGGGEYAAGSNPTTRIVLQEEEAQMLRVLGGHVDALKAQHQVALAGLRDRLDGLVAAQGQERDHLDKRVAEARERKRMVLRENMYLTEQLHKAQAQVRALQQRGFWQRVFGR